MRTSFERFLAGDDGIATLLRALPAHAPPASMDAWFAQAARTADAERNAATPTQDGLQFEAPSTMAAVFAAAAAQAEQAQAAQRAAVQARLAQGERADQALGADLSESARAWIAQQARTDTVDVLPTMHGSSEAASSRAAAVSPATNASTTTDVSLAADASKTAEVSASSNGAADASRAAARFASVPEIASASTSASTSASASAAQAQAQAQAQPSTLQASGSSSTSTHTSNATGLRNSRRPRWMPTLALAASITLAVGIGLQWQARQPMRDVPAATTPETAFAKPQENYEAQRDANQVDRAADSTSDMPVMPAPAYAEAPNAAARPIAASPSRSSLPPALPSPAPAFAPEPVSEPSLAPAAAPAPVPPLAAVPASAPPLAAMIAAEPAPSVDAPSIDAQAPAAPPPPSAPIAAIPEDARVSGSLAATAHRSAPASVSIAPDTPSAPASPPTQTSLIEQTKTDASLAETPLISRAAPVTGQAAPLRTRHAPTPHLDAYRAASPSSKPTVRATMPDAEAYQVKGSVARKPGLLNLSTSPGDWLARYAVSADRMPARIRIWAAKADAPEVQSWATRLRNQLKQRGWSTQVDVVQDTQLAADQLRLETFDTAQ